MPLPHTLRVPRPAAAPLTGRLPFADAPGVPDPIEVTSRCLTRGGRPWFPVSGEFHYSRYPAGEWEEELLKMKAAGVTAVASYVIWIHHEETEGRVRFDGDRDLRRFAQLAARHGLDFVPRIGPWSHAEVRNGGLPDWVLARDCAPRTDDPAYLEPVRTWFAALAEQLRGLDRAHGGPIVAIQIENELYDRPGHLLTLKRMAQEAGLSAPLWTSTAWGGVQLPGEELLPLYGGYPEAFWTEADGGWPDTCRKHFFFTHQRDDEGIGADLRPTAVRGGDPEAHADRFPWATCELGGGMAVAYHRRPRVDAADIGALGLTKIGCGSVWQGYYMFHGGTNPAGERTSLQESHATGYPNDLPLLTYDFQAPSANTARSGPRTTNCGSSTCCWPTSGSGSRPCGPYCPSGGRPGSTTGTPCAGPCGPTAPRASSSSPTTSPTNRSRRTRRRPFTVEFPDAPALTLPSTPVTVPTGAYFCWPLRLDIAGLLLDWATAQPVCTVEEHGRTVLVLAATDGIAPELALRADTLRSVSSPSGETVTAGDRVLVTGLRPGTDALVEAETADGTRVGLLVLDAAAARTVYTGTAWGAERLLLSADPVVFDHDEVRVHGAAAQPAFAVLPAPDKPLVVAGATVKEAADGVLTRYTLVTPEPATEFPVTATPVRAAGAAPVTVTGVQGRASVPDDTHFDTVAAEYRIDLPETVLAGADRTLLRLTWTGDVARAYVGDRLVADQFHSGRPWDIALDRLPAEALRGEGLRVRVLPLAVDAPVYVPAAADTDRGTAVIHRAELRTTRVRAVRAG